MAALVTGRDPVIRTPDQRLRVFVSSTLQELAPERVAVRAAIERLHLIPVLFELGARPHAPRALYRSYLAQSHVFVGIYWQRYGWVAPDETISGLEDEYRRSHAIPQLIYIKEPAQEREPELERLLATIRTDDRASYRTFHTADELAALVQDDIVVLLTERFESVARPSGMPELAWQPQPTTTAPVPSTSTIGRDEAIDTVASLLVDQRVRLLTVTGPGGVGKSRLGLEVAHRVAPAFPDGVHLISLEAVRDPRAVLRAIADQLGIVGEGLRPLDHLVADMLRDRFLLLVVDNFEQVVDAGPDLATLLDRCRGVQALVTSRRPLRLRGERTYPLPPLTLPETDPPDVAASASPAVALFIERARAVRPDYTPDAVEIRDIVALVRSLDGLPLAIELAAARIPLLPPAMILRLLEERLDVLADGAQDMPERQRTLRTAIDWSYRLLSDEQRRMFDRLSVFAGGATIEAAAAVGGEDHPRTKDPRTGRPGAQDVLGTLSSLLEENLLVTTVSDGEPRLKMLFTVRAFAAERLEDSGEHERVADRHADWFLSRAELVDPLRDPAAHQRHTLMLVESDDLQAAMDWVVARGDVRRAAAFASSTWMWFWLRGRLVEVRPWFEAANRLADRDDAGAADRATLRFTTGQIREILGEAQESIGLTTEALGLYEQVGDEVRAGATHIALSAALPSLGRVGESREHAEQALRIGERYDEPHLIGFANAMIGTALAVGGQPAEARRAFEAALTAGRRIQFPMLEGQALVQLAFAASLERDVDGAWAHLRAAADVLAEHDSCELTSYWLEFAATALLVEDDAVGAVRALAAARTLRDEIQIGKWPLLEAHNRQTWIDATSRAGTIAPSLVAEMGPSEARTLLGELLEAHAAPHLTLLADPEAASPSDGPGAPRR